MADVERLLPKWSHERIESHIAGLLVNGTIRAIERGGERFLVRSELRYPQIRNSPTARVVPVSARIVTS